MRSAVVTPGLIAGPGVCAPVRPEAGQGGRLTWGNGDARPLTGLQLNIVKPGSEACAKPRRSEVTSLLSFASRWVVFSAQSSVPPGRSGACREAAESRDRRDERVVPVGAVHRNQ